jgi:hypothetical protein
MKDDGGGAFPVVRTDITGNRGNYMSETYSEGGMTLRDYMAAKAMQGMVANEGWRDWGQPEMVAKAAYGFADKMLAERNKT